MPKLRSGVWQVADSEDCFGRFLQGSVYVFLKASWKHKYLFKDEQALQDSFKVIEQKVGWLRKYPFNLACVGGRLRERAATRT